MKVYVFDLDGTITDTRQRDHLNPRLTEGYDGNGDRWIPFSMAAEDDAPNWPVIHLMQALAGLDHAVFIITGRTERAWVLTKRWLAKHGVPHDLLSMRGEGDHRPNVELKLDRLGALREDGHEVALWVDDYPKVTEAMKAEGIPTMLVDFELRT